VVTEVYLANNSIFWLQFLLEAGYNY